MQATEASPVCISEGAVMVTCQENYTIFVKFSLLSSQILWPVFFYAMASGARCPKKWHVPLCLAGRQVG